MFRLKKHTLKPQFIFKEIINMWKTIPYVINLKGKKLYFKFLRLLKYNLMIHDSQNHEFSRKLNKG